MRTAALALTLLVACSRREPGSGIVGDAARGQAMIVKYGCTSCHIVPGVRGNGLVGPPLTHMARRGYIAGRLTNVPQRMIDWIRSPQKISPGNAMPDVGVTEKDARDIAAYLYTLGSPKRINALQQTTDVR